MQLFVAYLGRRLHANFIPCYYCVNLLSGVTSESAHGVNLYIYNETKLK